jgi:hypothetical protein
MNGFTDMERAALHSIFAETPKVEAELRRQLERAIVAKRENSGAGFFTSIEVSSDVPAVCTEAVLGYETMAHVCGFQHAVGFVLFMSDGRLSMLECYTFGPESTTDLDLSRLTFTILRKRMDIVG